MPHMMFADAGHEAFRDQHTRAQTRRHRDGHMTNTAPVVLHSQVFQMLFDRRDRDDAGSQFARLHPLPELAAGELAQQDFRFTHGLGSRLARVGAPAGSLRNASPFGSMPFGSGTSSVMILQLAPISRSLRKSR